MQNFKIAIQYDGTNYHGWQIQINGRTIQGELTRVLSMLDHRPVTIHGAGRTDAGVHAEGQVASCFLDRNFETDELRDAINGNLDRDIRINSVECVADEFNARQCAKKKTYRYRIWTASVVSPFVYRYVHSFRGQLDLETMRSAAASLIGKHDFSAFTSGDSDVQDHVRTLFRLDIQKSENEVLILAEGDGFLRYMVRTIAGTLIDVARGKQSATRVSKILESRDRSLAGFSAPANGLTLVRVDY
jgi:tRNA pseudouridine38-40 synthase